MIHKIALTMIDGVGDVLARQLLQSMGSAEAVFVEKQRLLAKIPGIGAKLASEIVKPSVLARAEKECAFVEKNKIKTFFIADENYPFRLRELTDAPILFYYKGNADLNAPRIISIVGTRKASEYGRGLTEKFLKDIAELLPNTLVVSGLAYGIDIHSHQQALHLGLPTVGVLAHGLDRIYPAVHRKTAIEMLEKGGLLTDYPHETSPDRPNFVHRNRIVAGLSDATIVVESAERGGSLITADIAFSYDRSVFAFPGRVHDLSSKGCNLLIRQNKAALISSAKDFVSAMMWDIPKVSTPTPMQGSFQFDPPVFDHPILQVLHEKQELHVNQLAKLLSLPVHELTSQLFELEMQGRIKVLPGNVYKVNL